MIDIADDHYALDITRARTLLGWEPRHSLRETLPTMIAALKADPVGWYRANKLNAAKVTAQSLETRAPEYEKAEDPIEHHEMMRKHHEECAVCISTCCGCISSISCSVHGSRPV